MIRGIEDIDTGGVDIKVEGTSNWVENGDVDLLYSDNDGTKIVEFYKDLSIYPCYMKYLVIDIEDTFSSNSLLLIGFYSKDNETKIIYLKLKDSIKYEDITYINKVYEDCFTEDEYFFENVKLMASSSSMFNEYVDISCESYADKLSKIEGLRNYVVVKFDKTVADVFNSSYYSKSNTVSNLVSDKVSVGLSVYDNKHDGIIKTFVPEMLKP